MRKSHQDTAYLNGVRLTGELSVKPCSHSSQNGVGLVGYAWENDFCFPGQDTLGKDIGVTRQTANTYIKELSTKGFIKVKRQGFNKPNLYEVNLKAKVLTNKGK